MRALQIYILILILATYHFSQSFIEGEVIGITENKNQIILIGANVYWKNTDIGTSSNELGKFKITYLENKELIVSFVGFESETVLVSKNEYLKIYLRETPKQINEITAIANRTDENIDYLSAEKISIITNKELAKAACCNLSESFERNASIDATYADAITGIKQIEAMGISGIYTSIALENIPFIRGLYSQKGLTILPGAWIENIYYSKGAMSVVNGYEAISGGINIELKNIFDFHEKYFYNLYYDNEKRFETNGIFRHIFSDKLASIALFNYAIRKNRLDHNKDGFYDMPDFDNFSAMNRWQFYNGNLEGNFQLFYNKENKQGGLIRNDLIRYFPYKSNSELCSFSSKIGYNFSDEHSNSLGSQIQFVNFENDILLGSKTINSNQLSFYGNIIYQKEILEEIYEIKTGANFSIDKYKETFPVYKETEFIVYGIYLENTYKIDESLNIILGIRNDYIKNYKSIFSPRLNIRYAINEDFIFRTALGKGFRKHNIINDNIQYLSSNRSINLSRLNFDDISNFMDIGWNFGGGLTYHFTAAEESYLNIDFYRTEFERILVMDMDSNPQEIKFYNANNGAFSNSFLIEANILATEEIELKIAYKYLNSKIKINDKFIEKPFISKNRILFNCSYSFKLSKNSNRSYEINFSLNWFDKKRLPNTNSNPIEFRMPNYSKSYFTANAHINAYLHDNFSLYVGVENLFDYKQKKIIIDYENPSSIYFDASMIWGPTQARMVYAGIRHSL